MPELGPNFEARKNVTKKKIISALEDLKSVDRDAIFNRNVPNFGGFGERREWWERYPVPEWIRFLAEEVGGHILGAGGERAVIDLGNGKLLGIYRENKDLNAKDLKALFHTFKVLHILFPQHFPHMYAAGISSSLPKNLQFLGKLFRKVFPEHVVLFDIKEKVVSSDNSNDNLQKFEAGKGGYNDQINIAVQALSRLGIKLSIDHAPENVLGDMYIDSRARMTGLDDRPLTGEHLEKLIWYMREHNYSDNEISDVEKPFKRLFDLGKK